MGRNDSGLDLLFLVIGLIIEVAEASSKKKRHGSITRGGLSTSASPLGKGQANAMSRLQQMEQDHKTGGGPVYDPMKNKPVKTVSKEDRMAAFTAIQSGKTLTKGESAINYSKENRYHGLSNNAKQIKLEVLLLSYMFQEDDGKITRKERKAIRNHYSKSVHLLTEEDVDYIKDIRHMDNSLLNIRSYISQQEVSETDITNSIRTIKECNSSPKKYDSIIQRIESSLLESMGY